MIEYRTITSEIRAASKEGKNIIEGHAAMFDVRSLDIGFTEMIHKGAFDLADMSDVRMLNDHVSHMVLARSKSGTLSLSIDDKGLFYTGEVADTSYGRDLLVSIGRGDVDQSSFGFMVEKDDWEYTDGALLRHILQVKSVVDVSPTAFPAYPQTHIDKRMRQKVEEVRSLLSKPKMDASYVDTMIKVHNILSQI